jgi:hypothetical protein
MDYIAQTNTQRLFLAMANPGSHTSLLTPDFTSSTSSFLYTHEKAPVEIVPVEIVPVEIRIKVTSRGG